VPPLTKATRGKTETIKQRSIDLYLPTIEMAEDWKRMAKESKMSLSKFITQKVLESLAPESGMAGNALKMQHTKELEMAYEEKKEIEEENAKLRQENRMLRMLSDNLDRELKKLRAAPFLEAGFVGTRKFDKALIDLLKEGRALEGDQILRRLNVEPADSELVKAITNQLDALLAYDLLQYDGRWWKWKG
jgi:oligoendopeptidase F